MPSRRAVLGRVVAALIAGTLTVPTAAGNESSEPSSGHNSTTVTATVDPSVVGLAGVPTSLRTTLADLERAAAVSVADVESLSGTATIESGQLIRGRALVRGEFDADRTAQRLQSHDARFRPVGHATKLNQEAGTANTGPLRAEGGERHALISSDGRTAVSLGPERLVVSLGTGSKQSLKQLAAVRSRGAESLTDTNSLGTALDGDTVVHARLDEHVRDRIHAQTAGAPASFTRLLRATRAGGVALDSGPESSRLRYGAVIDSGLAVAQSVDDLLEELNATEQVELHDSVVGEHRLVADVAVETSALWTVHQQLLGTSW